MTTSESAISDRAQYIHSDIINCGCVLEEVGSGMRPLTLSAPEHSRAVLQQEINRHQDARYAHRLHCVLLVASGLSCEQTAGLFGDSPRTLVNWGRRFDRQGLAGLAEGNHSGRPARLSAEPLEEVRGWVRQPPTAAAVDAHLWDGKSLAAGLQKRDGVPVSVRQCQRRFRLVATRYRLRRPLVAKGAPQRPAKHKKLQAWAHDPALALWSLDEVHFCQPGSRCRLWVPWEEADPVLWPYPGRKSVGYYGAVRRRDGQGFFRQEPEMFDGRRFGVSCQHRFR